MSAIGRRLALPGRRLGPRPAAVAAPPGPPPPSDAERELLERRERLSRELAELQFDLGGLTYEMAIRDHFRMDVLVRHAARLQQVDSELGAIERLAHMEEAGAAGTCPTCHALYGRGAVFCWQCGTTLMAQAPVGPSTGNGGSSGAQSSSGLDASRPTGEHHNGAGGGLPSSAGDAPGGSHVDGASSPSSPTGEAPSGAGEAPSGAGADFDRRPLSSSDESGDFDRRPLPSGEGGGVDRQSSRFSRPQSPTGPQAPAGPQSPPNP